MGLIGLIEAIAFSLTSRREVPRPTDRVSVGMKAERDDDGSRATQRKAFGV